MVSKLIRQCGRNIPTTYVFHNKPWLGARNFTAEKSLFSHPSSSASTFQLLNAARWLPKRSASVVATYLPMTYVRKLVLLNNGKQWKTALRHPLTLRTSVILDTQASQVGPFEASKVKTWYSATSTGNRTWCPKLSLSDIHPCANRLGGGHGDRCHLDTRQVNALDSLKVHNYLLALKCPRRDSFLTGLVRVIPRVWQED